MHDAIEKPKLAYAGGVHRIIHIHPEAPLKPPEGLPCNGCGVCCLAEPCPVGVLVSRRWRGACKALVWSDAVGLYRCGLLGDASGVGGQAAPFWRRLWQRWVRRMIASGVGCDASIEVDVAAYLADEVPREK